MKFVKATVCLSVCLALSACSENASVESHLSNARTYLSENKVNEGVIELKNAIKLDTKNAEARFLLGKLYLELGDGLAAVKELERARALKYAENKVLPLLARSYVLTEADDDVLALSDAAQALTSIEQSQYFAYKTLAALRSEDMLLAKASAQIANEANEQGVYAMLAEAYVQLAENNFEQAQTLISRILTIDTSLPDALMLQGQVATLMKNYVLASESFKQYQELQPRSGVVQLLLADALLKAGEYQEAEQYADAILASVSGQPFAHYIKAMARFQQEDFKKASEHAEQALSAKFNQFNLKLVAGASAFYLKNWEQSHHHLSSIVSYLPTEHQARRMLAVSQLELGLVDEISATLGEFNAENEGDAQFLSSVSFKLLELGATNEAKKLLERSNQISQPDANQNARQGILKLMMNDPSGIQDLKDAVQLNPEFIEAELALAFAALQANDIEQAKTIANKWQDKYPEKAGGFNLMASIHIKLEEYQQAEQLLQKSLAIEENNVFALTEQLRIARLQKNEVLSKELADKAIELYPDNNKILRHYFGAYKNEQALDRLAAVHEQDKKNVQKGMLYSEALIVLRELNKAASVLQTFEHENKLPKRYWQLLSLVYRQKQDINQVQSVLEKWLKANPYHIEPVVLLADLYAGQRKYDRGLIVVNRAFDYHPDNLILQLVKMQLLLNSKQVEQAKQNYNKLALTEINDNLKKGFLGRILLLERKFIQAVPKLEDYYRDYPSSQNVVYLTAAYLGNNDSGKAVQLMEKHLQNEPENARIKTMLAGLYLEGDKNKAISVYSDIAKQQPSNVVVNNNLAWLYLEQGKVDKAIEHAEKAMELAPQIPNVVDTYGKVLLKKGDKRAALKQATRANELANGKDIDIALNYIEALIANSRNNEAKTLLSALQPKTDEQRDKKEALLTQL